MRTHHYLLATLALTSHFSYEALGNSALTLTPMEHAQNFNKSSLYNWETSDAPAAAPDQDAIDHGIPNDPQSTDSSGTDYASSSAIESDPRVDKLMHAMKAVVGKINTMQAEIDTLKEGESKPEQPADTSTDASNSTSTETPESESAPQPNPVSKPLDPVEILQNPDLLDDDATYSMTVSKVYKNVYGTHEAVMEEFSGESGAELKDYILHSMRHQPDLVISKITEDTKATHDPKEESKSVMKSVLPTGSKSVEAPAKLNVDSKGDKDANNSWFDDIKEAFDSFTHKPNVAPAG